jgi:hypothetical protein
MEEPMTAEQGVALTMARYQARKAVKQRLWDRGVKLSIVSAKDITEWADAMIEENPQMLVEALATVRQSPELQRIVRSRERFCAKLRSDAQRQRR